MPREWERATAPALSPRSAAAGETMTTPQHVATLDALNRTVQENREMRLKIGQLEAQIVPSGAMTSARLREQPEAPLHSYRSSGLSSTKSESVDQLRDEVLRLERENDLAISQFAEASRAASEATAQVKELQRRLRAKEAQVEQQEREHKGAAMTTTATEVVRLMGKHEAEERAWKEERKHLVLEAQDAKMQLEALRSDTAGARLTQREARQQILTLSDRLRSVRGEKEELQQKVVALSLQAAELATLQRLHGPCDGIIADLRRERDTLQGRVAEQSDELRRYTTNTQTNVPLLLKQKQALEERVLELTSERDKSIEVVDRFKSQLDIKQVRAHTLFTNLTAMQDRIDELESQNSSLIDEVARLRNDHRSSATENMALRADISLLQEEARQRERVRQGHPQRHVTPSAQRLAAKQAASTRAPRPDVEARLNTEVARLLGQNRLMYDRLEHIYGRLARAEDALRRQEQHGASKSTSLSTQPLPPMPSRITLAAMPSPSSNASSASAGQEQRQEPAAGADHGPDIGIGSAIGDAEPTSGSTRQAKVEHCTDSEDTDGLIDKIQAHNLASSRRSSRRRSSGNANAATPRRSVHARVPRGK